MYLIEPQFINDERGGFARVYCENEFGVKGLNTNPVQSNISYNRHKGTLRGMHFQRAPSAEAKLVRCTSGSIYDVVIDLRSGSGSFLQWVGFELSAANRMAVYIPEGFAHGFQTLSENTEVFYQMFNFFSPEDAGGVRYDDPEFAITWPIPDPVVSEKDRNYPDFDGFAL